MAKLTAPTAINGDITIIIRDHDVEIEITDESSHCRILNVTVPALGFLSALGRHAAIKCGIELYHGPIGFKSETKIERVAFPADRSTWTKDPEQEAKLLALEAKCLTPYLADGWRPNQSGSNADYRNGHRIDTTKSEKAQGLSVYKVTFRRYVHPETGQVWDWEEGQ